MRILTALFLLFLLSSCQHNPQGETQQLPSFQLLTEADPELEYHNLRLYPIIAEEAFMEAHAPAAQYKNLGEAIKNDRFRITEKKPFGRFEDPGAINVLTVQNKSENTAFLMAGDIVQGGKQDRVIAQDLVVPPRSITDVSVFCVEPHRWQARSEIPENRQDDPRTADKNKSVYAFTGYYNVASNNIRRTVTQSKNQREVWEKVGEVTAIHNAQTSTGTYTALEQSSSFTRERDQYVRFFEDKFDQQDQVVGIVAVSGDKVIGTDIFAHPALFQKQYKALIHSYIVDAITNGSPVKGRVADMDQYTEQLARKYQLMEEARYEYEGIMVHFTDL